jgi:ribokinase
MTDRPGHTASIAVVGSANVDTSIQVPAIPRPGETLLGSGHSRAVGGKGANQAVAAKLLGVDVSFIGCVGMDADADLIANRLNSLEIDTRSLMPVDAPTGLATILVTPQGENSIVVAPGANSSLSSARLMNHRQSWAQHDLVVVQCEVPKETVERVAVEASTRGRVIINAAPATMLAPEAFAVSDPLVVNVLEAEWLMFPDQPHDPMVRSIDEARLLARELFDKLAPRSVVLTLGGAGVVSIDSARCATHYPAIPVSVVDTSGAGDCFVGALAAELARQRSLDQAIRFATAASALAVTRRGAQSFPTHTEVEVLLRKNTSIRQIHKSS